MNIQVSQSEICLSKRQTITLVDTAGVRIDAREGSVWVTQDHDPRDIVLHTGESFTLAGNSRAIVQALEPARLSLWQSAATPRTERSLPWAARLRSAFSRRSLRLAGA